MIGRIQGIVVEKNFPQVIVACNGVGYEIDVPMSTFYPLPRIGEEVTLLTHLVVREDAHLLFGFVTAGERAAFRQLLKISGVGPKVALSVLSGLSVDDLAAAVATGDAGAAHEGAGHRQEDRRAPGAGAARQAAEDHQRGACRERGRRRLGRAQCAALPWLQ